MAQTNFSGPVASENGFLDGSDGKTDFSQIVGIEGILLATVGTWTITRAARGNYVYRHTAGAETAVIGIDITPLIRTATDKGVKLTTIDVVYSIGTEALTAHTATLDSVSYANNAAVTITDVPITGTLATATQANPYVTTLTITTPAFLNTADAKYVLELTVNAAATSAYDFIGIIPKYTRNDL